MTALIAAPLNQFYVLWRHRNRRRIIIIIIIIIADWWVYDYIVCRLRNSSLVLSLLLFGFIVALVFVLKAFFSGSYISSGRNSFIIFGTSFTFKLWFVNSAIECDLNINNSVGIRNTHLLSAYNQRESLLLHICIKSFLSFHAYHIISDLTLFFGDRKGIQPVNPAITKARRRVISRKKIHWLNRNGK